MKKEKRQTHPIMVVKQDVIFDSNYFNGFISANMFDYESKILKNFGYMSRCFADGDHNYKQPISYGIVTNFFLNQIFVYRREKKGERYTEKRLQGKLSLGVGGHIEQSDSGNPIHSSLRRELKEEIRLRSFKTPKVLGYINDDSDDVGKDHLGILYLIETSQSVIKPKPKGELASGRLIPFSKLESLIKTAESPKSKIIIENWSKIAYGALKKYFR